MTPSSADMRRAISFLPYVFDLYFFRPGDRNNGEQMAHLISALCVRLLLNNPIRLAFHEFDPNLVCELPSLRKAKPSCTSGDTITLTLTTVI